MQLESILNGGWGGDMHIVQNSFLATSQQRGLESCMCTGRVLVFIENNVSLIEVKRFSQATGRFFVYRILAMHIAGDSLGTACVLYHLLGALVEAFTGEGGYIS